MDWARADARARTIGIGMMLIVLAASLYAPMRENGYVYEDQETVDQSMARGEELMAHPFTSEPLSLDASRLSMWLPAKLFGNTPLTHHRVNLALHLACGAMLAMLLVELGATTWGWVLGTALFLGHAIQVETVGLAASRSELMMTLFLVWALYVGLAKPLTEWRSVSVLLLGFVSMASKQDGVLIVLLLPLLLWHRHADRRYVLAITIAWLASVGSIAYWMATRGEAMALPFYGLLYAGYQSVAFWNLLSLVAWPWNRLNIDHDIGNYSHLVAYLALTASCLCVMAGIYVRKYYAPLLGSAMLWPFVVIIPRVVLRLPEWFSEHQFYLAMAGLSMTLALSLTAVEKGRVAI